METLGPFPSKKRGKGLEQGEEKVVKASNRID